MKRSINPSISPNLEKDDIWASVKMLFSPFSIKQGEYINKVEGWFKYNFSAKYVFSFSSGREGEYAILSAAGVGRDDEVLVQAFTCSAVVYPILWLEAKPVYVDIDKNNLSMDVKSLKKRINKKTRAIILQHTFGMTANIDEVCDLARKKKILLIEDCAHVIGGLHQGKKLGTFGDAAIFSFGRDKAVSSVFGGVVITNEEKIAEKIKKIEDIAPYPSYIWIYQQLLHPIITSLVLKGFSTNDYLGKYLLYVFKKIHMISKTVIEADKATFLGKSKVKRYPNALAHLSFNQLFKINRFNKKRLHIYNVYKSRLSKLNIKLPENQAFFLRIPVLSCERKKMQLFFKRNSVYLGDWYSNIIDPKWTNLSEMLYKKGTCRKAEYIAERIVNLPSYPTMKNHDVEEVVRLMKKYYGKKRKARS